MILGVLLFVLGSPAARTQTQAVDPTVQTLRLPSDVAQALWACFIPPPTETSYPGMQITVRVSFNRKGEVLGQPHVTYETPSAPEGAQAAYREAMLDAVTRCTPLTFAAELGRAFAGQPFYLRYIDSRTSRE
jgi:hypothetical protein